MEEVETHAFIAYAQLPVFKRRVAEALALIAQGMKIAPAMVGCSWGKDSTTLLHLAQQIKSDIPTVHFRTPLQDMLDDFQYVKMQYCDRFSPNYSEIGLDLEVTIPMGVRASRLSERYPVSILGVRAQESKKRRCSIAKYGCIHQYQSGVLSGSWRVFPLAKWNWQDVWAYVCLHDLPYLSSYDHFSSEGRDRSRTTNVMPFLGGGSDSQRMGRIAQIKANAPEAYAFLLEFYPEIASST